MNKNEPKTKCIKKGEYYEIEQYFDDDEEKTIPKNVESSQDQSNKDSSSYQHYKIDKFEVKPSEVFEKFYNEQGMCSVVYGENPKSQGILETPAQKLARIQTEIQELKDTLVLMNDEQKKQTQLVGQGSALGVIENLEKEIANVANNEQFKQLFSLDGKTFKYDTNLSLLKNEFQQSVTQNLQAQIKELSQQNQANGQQGKVEVYLDKERNEQHQNEKYVELEKRVNYLEEILGKSQLQKENFPTQQDSLISKIENLEMTVTGLNDRAITDIGAKVEKIQADVENAQNMIDKKLGDNSDNLNPSNVKKITDLYENVQKITGIQDELPLVIDRLESLKLVHEESAGFMININTLTDLHTKVLDQLGSNDQLLGKLQTNFETNLTGIESNMQNLEQRINNLKQ